MTGRTAGLGKQVRLWILQRKPTQHKANRKTNKSRAQINLHDALLSVGAVVVAAAAVNG
jgi:hypothetical protein